MSQKVEKVQKGAEGSAKEIIKSTIQNVDFLTREGGGHILIFSPNVNADFKCFSWTKNKWFLKWFLGNFMKTVCHQRVSSIKFLQSKVVFHQRVFSIKGPSPPKVPQTIKDCVPSNIKEWFPSKFLFHERLSIIKGCSPSKVLQTLSYSLIRSHLKVPPQCFPWGRRGWGWEVQLEVSQSNQLKWSWLDWNWDFKINLSVMLHMPTCVWLLSAKCVTS